MPLKRLCDLAPSAHSPWRSGAAVLRTSGTELASDDLTCWSNAPFLAPAERVLLCAASAARATDPAVERFYTTVEPLRERATEGWSGSTLTTKETR